jgi:phenylpyruvate tautomerase PptA (4-oxalocrotonate tautomerase family)
MPIVRVELLPGRDAVQKEFLARAIADALAEIAGSTREGVHTLFIDVAADSWAIGPRLVANAARKAMAERDPAVVAVERLRIKPGRTEDYLTWRRARLYPFLASCPGFVTSTLLAVGDEHVSLEKWETRGALDVAVAAAVHDEAREWLMPSAGDDLVGCVVDVFGS